MAPSSSKTFASFKLKTTRNGRVSKLSIYKFANNNSFPALSMGHLNIHMSRKFVTSFCFHRLDHRDDSIFDLFVRDSVKDAGDFDEGTTLFI